MQMRNSVHRSVLSCAKTLYRTEGFQAFYISYPTTLTMNIPLSAVQFSVYEAVKSYINPSGEYSPATHCIAGGIAGGTAAAVTTPLDVAKVSRTRGTSSATPVTDPLVALVLLADSLANARNVRRPKDPKRSQHVASTRYHLGSRRMAWVETRYCTAGNDICAEYGHLVDVLRVLQ